LDDFCVLIFVEQAQYIPWLFVEMLNFELKELVMRNGGLGMEEKQGYI